MKKYKKYVFADQWVKECEGMSEEEIKEEEEKHGELQEVKEFKV